MAKDSVVAREGLAAVVETRDNAAPAEGGTAFHFDYAANLAKALQELLDVADSDPRDLPRWEYEEITAHARGAAQNALNTYRNRWMGP